MHKRGAPFPETRYDSDSGGVQMCVSVYGWMDGWVGGWVGKGHTGWLCDNDRLSGGSGNLCGEGSERDLSFLSFCAMGDARDGGAEKLVEIYIICRRANIGLGSLNMVTKESRFHCTRNFGSITCN